MFLANIELVRLLQWLTLMLVALYPVLEVAIQISSVVVANCRDLSYSYYSQMKHYQPYPGEDPVSASLLLFVQVQLGLNSPFGLRVPI